MAGTRLARPIFGIAASLSLVVFAQNFPRLAPLLPQPKAKPGPVPSSQPGTGPATAPSDNPDEVILTAMKRLVLIASSEKLAIPAAADGAPVQIDVPALAGSGPLEMRLRSYLDKPVTRRTLDLIASDILAEHRRIGRPLVDVVIPEQDVTNGVVQVLVLEGVVGQVRFEGNRFFSTNLLKSSLSLRPGQPVRTDQLVADLNQLNQNPFRTVEVTYQRGGAPGETDLVFRVNDSLPLRLYAGYDNSGTEALGVDRYLAGFNYGNLFGIDHQLNYQFTTSQNTGRFQAHSFSYLAPLENGHNLLAFGSWSRSRPDLEQTDPAADLNSTGESWQLSGRFRTRLPSHAQFSHVLSVGLDFKESNNNLEFGGDNVFDGTTQIFQVNLNYSPRWNDKSGYTSASFDLYFSPGRIGGNNNDDAFDEARAGADATYTYGAVALERQLNLPHQAILLTRIAAQLADGPLISSEQFGIGGAESVRGYNERALNGDSGALASLELQSMPFAPLQNWGGGKLRDELRFCAFADFGATFNRNADADNPAAAHALSAGPGIRYRVGAYLTLEYFYGFQLDDQEIDDTENGRHHLSLSLGIDF